MADKLVNPINATRIILRTGKEIVVVADEIAPNQVLYKVLYL